MKTRLWGLALLALAVSGCGGQKEREAVELFGDARAFDEHLIWIDKNADEALVLDVMDANPDPELHSYAVEDNTVLVQRRNGVNEMLLLSRGERPGEGSLSVLGPQKVLRRYELGVRFDALAQSGDGAFALAYFGAGVGTPGDEDSLLFDPNAIAILQLDKEGEEAVVRRSLRGFGSSPRSVHFSPEMEVAGATRRLAVVLFQSHVALVDLSHPERPEYTIELSRRDAVGLNQVRFSAEERKIYLLGENSSDVYVISLLEAGTHRENDYEPSLNQLGAGRVPQDMALFSNAEGGQRLLVVGGQTALVIEASSNRVTEVPVGHSVSKVLLFEGTSPQDPSVEQRALIYSTQERVVTFLDLDDVEDRKSRNLEDVVLTSAVSSVHSLDNNRVLLLRGGGQGLSILDLESRSASELSARTQLTQSTIDSELSRLWVAPVGGRTVAYVDYAQDQSAQVFLDESIAGIHRLSSKDRQRLVITHPVQGGAVTVLDAKDPDNSDVAVTLRGFLLTHLLDQ